MENLRQELLSLLIKRSYEKRRVILTSGKESDFYIDGKQTTLDPRGAYLVGKLFHESLKGSQIDAVGGPADGAIPIVTAIALVSQLEGNPLPAFFVRKEQKKHGKQLWIEGRDDLPQGSKVAIIEDVVTTGGSIMKAITQTQAGGFKVVKVLAIVDREEGGKENLAQEGFQLESIYTKREIEQATSKGR
ncbi:MAG: orotate phosphoribosyltransferase [Candidatus Tectomicrobia bacterium]|nr:orotate phosphoribosyltransferase [Candidatus Tectomicrobia bacterium]